MVHYVFLYCINGLGLIFSCKTTALISFKPIIFVEKDMGKIVKWEKCALDKWAHLKTLDLTSPSLVENGMYNLGVYIIWSETEKRVIRVGSGHVAQRLDDHLKNSEILKHEELLVTFAIIKEREEVLSIETYLGYIYDPVVGDRFPDVGPLPVNLPNNGIPVINSEFGNSILSNALFEINFQKWKEKH